MIRATAHLLIRFYQLTLSAFVGRQCRYLPTCSQYTDDAIQAHGLWLGGWMGVARICRCRPGGGRGYDPAPPSLPVGATALTPWRHGVWRQPMVCEPANPDQDLPMA